MYNEKLPSPWSRLILFKDACLSWWHFPLWAQSSKSLLTSPRLRRTVEEKAVGHPFGAPV